MKINFHSDGVTVEDRQVVHNNKIVSSTCLVAKITMSDELGSCGFVGELRVVVGDIEVARKLQHVLDTKLKDID